MTENEAKAIKWMKNVRDDAVVTLDHIQKNEPNVSPMLYEGRKQKAETIIAGFEELAKYRAIGTAEEIQSKLEAYRELGTVEEFKALKEKNEPKKPDYEGDGYYNGQIVYDTWICPNCEKHYEVDYDDYDFCPNCGQHIDHSGLTEDD